MINGRSVKKRFFTTSPCRGKLLLDPLHIDPSIPKGSMGLAYIYLCIYHKNQLNVGKYTIHGSYGIWYSVPLNTGFQRCWHGKTKAFSSAGNLSTQHIRQFSFYTIPHPQRIYVWHIYLYIYHKKPNHYFGKYTIPMDPMDGSFRK